MKKETGKRIVFGILIATFALYCFLLAIRLFVDGRYHMGFWDRFARANFIPFKTIYDYAVMLANDRINVSTVFYNIFGNLIAFLPMGCYLPCFFERLRGVGNFCIAMLILLVSVEALQMLLGIGFFDIDDIILNFAGAIAGYAIVHVPLIKKFLRKIYVYR